MEQLETVGSQHWTIVNNISVSLLTLKETIIYFIRVHVNLIVCFYDKERYCDHFLGSFVFYVCCLFLECHCMVRGLEASSKHWLDER